MAEIVSQANQTNPDYVTLVGDGEPTLYADLGWVIEHTKGEVSSPVAVITNGSLLWREDVRSDLMNADVVIPTLDAGNQATFRRINRPHREISFASMLQGQIDFRRGFPGKLWLEVMLVRGVNDSHDELIRIQDAIERIKPDKVYILTPTRPPAESWVHPPPPERIIEAQHIIDQATAISGKESGEFGLQEFNCAEDAIMAIGSRHPLRVNQAKGIEFDFSEVGTVERMLKEGELVKVHYGEGIYLLPRRFLRGS